MGYCTPSTDFIVGCLVAIICFVIYDIVRGIKEKRKRNSASRSHVDPSDLARPLRPLIHDENPLWQKRKVALLQGSAGVRLSTFSEDLQQSSGHYGSSRIFSSDSIPLGLSQSGLLNWLIEQENQQSLLLYQCDQTYTEWTQLCLARTDHILIVVLASENSCVSRLETHLEDISSRKDLVLLYNHGEEPKNTADWLKPRSVYMHHHVRCYKNPQNIHSDMARLARVLMAQTVGLVLGGGGAKGAAHLGILAQIQKVGIPIDFVGGTSICAFIGALWSSSQDIEEVTGKTNSWFQKMDQRWQYLLDICPPYTALQTGRFFNKTVREVFGENAQIEDLLLPYYNITTDLTSSEEKVHRNGSLWRYVRSSMTIPGMLPPMIDSSDGSLLVDGCFSNNVPVDVMRAMGARYILAIDVGSTEHLSFAHYGDTINGWYVLSHKINPFSSGAEVPSMYDIYQGLAGISCRKKLKKLKKHTNYCYWFEPPVQDFGSLQFEAFETIKDVGYQYGAAQMATLQEIADKINTPTNVCNLANISISASSIVLPVNVQTPAVQPSTKGTPMDVNTQTNVRTPFIAGSHQTPSLRNRLHCTFLNCNRWFSTEESLQRHLRNDHPLVAEKFVCPQKNCTRWFKSKDKLNRHLKEDH